ncbi:hypothetical protein KDH_27510 [Dictyobacter sp. S3.2.2.5]|uniref:Uncharacterized protein n=1 Tax=Dictyobacter halimunensis TaxID=3026934 RepID=A0ABQ6FSA3_9CHLR|nr:hypothetical protein KDH_27510 [Dictyobacter sp. S3.2.2.5]
MLFIVYSERDWKPAQPVVNIYYSHFLDQNEKPVKDKEEPYQVHRIAFLARMDYYLF